MKSVSAAFILLACVLVEVEKRLVAMPVDAHIGAERQISHNITLVMPGCAKRCNAREDSALDKRCNIAAVYLIETGEDAEKRATLDLEERGEQHQVTIDQTVSVLIRARLNDCASTGRLELQNFVLSKA
ncbi:uncharacterized protein B0H18DRAFT_986849 [Fomitopsis serialis]|uniref:uncharacterized protein n=1 Tax=Fomitopsis serialis TaxID=139415 RepID=UPI00200854DE|nr:uncharacterized protein B0H18DRAFT_986849 [Neoantrodia serialis]KAH9932177.1 hypothetical protein B0H18DRAFT_986849 [Neoantrodia serialis]